MISSYAGIHPPPNDNNRSMTFFRALEFPEFDGIPAFQENPDAELQGKLLAEDPNPIDTAKRTLKKELKQAQAREILDARWTNG